MEIATENALTGLVGELDEHCKALEEIIGSSRALGLEQLANKLLVTVQKLRDKRHTLALCFADEKRAAYERIRKQISHKELAELIQAERAAERGEKAGNEQQS